MHKDHMDKKTLQMSDTKWAGRDFRYLEVTDSTNDDCVRFMQEGAATGIVVVAGQQLGGKGRRGRSWSSPPGESIYMTLGLKPDFTPDKASMLTLVMALAVVRAIRKVSGAEDAFIKWPNDIVMGGRKVCGILTEMHLDGEQIDCVVIGVGINVNSREFVPELAQTATSLFMESGQTYDCDTIITSVLESFEWYYEKFVEKCDMSTMMGEYVEKMINKDREVRVLDPRGEFTAIARCINEKGELLVEKEDGTTEAVYAGEVSVRGIYGYV